MHFIKKEQKRSGKATMYNYLTFKTKKNGIRNTNI